MERHLCISKYQKCKHWRTLEVVEADGPMVKPLLGPPLVRVSAQTWSWGHHYLPAQLHLSPPGQACEHFEGHIFLVLQCIQHHLSSSTMKWTMKCWFRYCWFLIVGVFFFNNCYYIQIAVMCNHYAFLLLYLLVAIVCAWIQIFLFTLKVKTVSNHQHLAVNFFETDYSGCYFSLITECCLDFMNWH